MKFHRQASGDRSAFPGINPTVRVEQSSSPSAGCLQQPLWMNCVETVVETSRNKSLDGRISTGLDAAWDERVGSESSSLAPMSAFDPKQTLFLIVIPGLTRDPPFLLDGLNKAGGPRIKSRVTNLRMCVSAFHPTLTFATGSQDLSDTHDLSRRLVPPWRVPQPVHRYRERNVHRQPDYVGRMHRAVAQHVP